MELSKCPFCGNQGPLITVRSKYRKGIANRLIYWVHCGYCEASQKHNGLAGFKTKDKAVEAWNKVSSKFS